MQIQLEKTLDVEVVERELAQLWKQTTGALDVDNDAAVLRARVANLLVFVASDALLNDAHQMMRELTASHPSRVLMMLGDMQAADRDIEMYITSICQTDKRTGARRLSCEEVTLKARGHYVAELPSAALPLVVSDLSTFLWWRDVLRTSDKVFGVLARRSDRLVIDSAEFKDPASELSEAEKLFAVEDCEHLGISDINWARLTFWRSLLADFYDVPAYQPSLDKIDRVQIDYVEPDLAPGAVAPQALLVAGWLATCLGWTIQREPSLQSTGDTISLNFSDRNGASITLELNRVERVDRKPGRLAKVELQSNEREAASFIVMRSVDNLHLVAEARLGPNTHRGRVLPVRNRSAAQLLSREMEILCNDDVYEAALGMAIQLVRAK